MPNQSIPTIELLHTAYAAFNTRDIDAALAVMAPDVHGPEEGRAYWTEQWSEIEAHVEPVAFYPEESGQILVDVHQVVRDLAGAVLADEHVGHRFSIQHGLIQAMEVCPLSSADLGA